MYENDIHVEFVDGAGARKTIPRGEGFCGFQAPPMRLCFGEVTRILTQPQLVATLTDLLGRSTSL